MTDPQAARIGTVMTQDAKAETPTGRGTRMPAGVIKERAAMAYVGSLGGVGSDLNVDGSLYATISGSASRCGKGATDGVGLLSRNRVTSKEGVCCAYLTAFASVPIQRAVLQASAQKASAFAGTSMRCPYCKV
jgi:hypothetical protein